MSIKSKKIVLAADGLTATVADATIGDILTTAISTSEAVTGAYGLVQKGLLFVGGMAVQNNRLGRGWNPISAS